MHRESDGINSRIKNEIYQFDWGMECQVLVCRRGSEVSCYWPSSPPYQFVYFTYLGVNKNVFCTCVYSKKYASEFYLYLLCYTLIDMAPSFSTNWLKVGRKVGQECDYEELKSTKSIRGHRGMGTRSEGQNSQNSNWAIRFSCSTVFNQIRLFWI